VIFHEEKEEEEEEVMVVEMNLPTRKLVTNS
jgi:hypothetical protein